MSAASATPCPRCGNQTTAGAAFCAACGASLRPLVRDADVAASVAEDPASLPIGERKTLTVLFADIKGSMELLEELDPEDARAVIDPALGRMTSCVRRYEGHVAQTLGDGIFALFGAPVAHEDHPRRALYAALAMQEEIRAYARMLRLEKGLSLEIRVGVNTGEAVLRALARDEASSDYTPVGHATSLAARLQALAAPGSVVVSEATRRLCEGWFRFRSLGPTRVKGASEPVELHEVTGVGAVRTRLEVAERRGLTRFVGREEELARVGKALEVARGGQGQIVAVTGEAGVGKSRLLYELRRSIGEGTLVLEAFAVPQDKSYPYLPIVELLKGYLRITARDDEAERREKLTAKVSTLDRSLQGELPFLFPLLEITDPSLSTLGQMDPEVRRERTHRALRKIFLAETVSQPVVILVEDLHWIDGESEAVLGALAEGLGGARLLLLTTARPEYDDRLLARSYTTRLRLDPLPQAGTEEILEGLLGREPGLDSLKRLIAERVEGNPFFLEEIVQELFEKGVLVRNRSVKITRPLSEIRLPASVEGVLAARIDRLPGREKELLQTGAVLGRTFTVSLAEAVSGQGEEELRALLARLERAELVYEKPAFPEPEHTFKHALTREVAYNSVLKEKRKLLHERAAGAIERLFADRLEEHYGELGHHYRESENAEKAIDYLTLAGRQMVQRSANAEATAILKSALDLVARLPRSGDSLRRELLVLTTLGPALVATEGYGSADFLTTYSRADELARESEDAPQRFSALRGTWMSWMVRGEVQKALPIAQELLTLARTLGDPFIVEANRAVGNTLFRLGEPSRARRHHEEAVALYEPRMHQALAVLTGEDSGVACLTGLAWALWQLGYPDQASATTEQAISLARKLNHGNSLGYAVAYAAHLRSLRREPVLARERADAAVAWATEHGLPYWSTYAEFFAGWALAEETHDERGVTLMQRALDRYRTIGSRIHLSALTGMLSDVLRRFGRLAEAGVALDLAFAAAENANERWWSAELLRSRGELLLATGGASADDAAERSFREAIELASRQDARTLELRATVSLARLLRASGRADEARSILAEIYSWFTEGFDTADLVEARSLLDELYRTPAPASAPPAAREAGPSDGYLRREGDYWAITYGEKVFRLRDTKGLRYLDHLLRHPGKEFHALELAPVASDGASGATARPAPANDSLVVSGLGDAGDVLDARARAEYRERLDELGRELDEATANNDVGRVERLRSEIEALEGELASAVGLGGRSRKAASVTEKARVNVTKAIQAAIARIAESSPALGSHLEATVRTGTFFGYLPDRRGPRP